MENEHYQPRETQSPMPSSQEGRSRRETGKAKSKGKSLSYYRYSSLARETTEALEKALAKLQQEPMDRRKMFDDPSYLFHRSEIQRAIRRVKFQLLMRKSPEAHELSDAWRTIYKRKYELQKAWEKNILAQEGEEGLKRRKQSGEGPINQYTDEELEIHVRYTRALVEGGVANPSELEYALEFQQAGGFNQWVKEMKRKNREAYIQQLATTNYPGTGQIVENIRQLNEEEYGKDYADQQHTILAELATIASQKIPSSTQDDTTL